MVWSAHGMVDTEGGGRLGGHWPECGMVAWSGMVDQVLQEGERWCMGHSAEEEGNCPDQGGPGGEVWGEGGAAPRLPVG